MIGQFLFFCKVMFDETMRYGSSPLIQAPIRRFFWLPLAMLLLAIPSLAQDNPSGLPLPRFATTRSEPINVRVGPGTKYEVSWTYLKSGIPVEIVQEFDTWRKIRDVDGAEGWVHQTLLSGVRAGYAAPILMDVTAIHQDQNGRGTSYSGYLHQEELWGVYPKEVFD